MDRRSFMNKISAALAAVGGAAMLPAFAKAEEKQDKLIHGTETTMFPCNMPPGHIPDAKAFAQILEGGHEEFMIKYQTTKGKVISEIAPFDRDDPMSHVLVGVIMPNPRLRIYMLGPETKKVKSPDARIIPYLYRV